MNNTTFAGAIIDRTRNGKRQILIVENNAIEIPFGNLEVSEDIYQTVRRVVKQKCGLEMTFINGEEDRIECENKSGVSSLIEPYCIVQLKNEIGLIFLGKAIGEPIAGSTWVDIEDITQIVTLAPDRIATACLAPLERYLDMI